MKTSIKKTACAVLAGSVFFAMTGCAETNETKKSERSEKKTEETTEETEESEAVDTDEILDTVEEYCDAIATADGETIVELSTDDLENADMIVEYLNYDGSTLYSSDMGDALQVITDTITYEIDEDSLEVDDDGETAEVDVVFNMFSNVSDPDAEFANIDEFAEAVENGETYDVTVTISLELTDDGWKISNTEDVFDDAYQFMIMAVLEPDFEFGADTTSGEEPDNTAVVATGDEPVLTYVDREWYEDVGNYPDVQYAPNYYARLTYADYEIDFNGTSASNISDWDFDTHTGTVESDTYDSFWFRVNYSCAVDDPDLSGFTYTIDHDGVVTVQDGSELELTISEDDSWTGNYTITLSDPWGRTIWEGYIEVV